MSVTFIEWRAAFFKHLDGAKLDKSDLEALASVNVSISENPAVKPILRREAIEHTRRKQTKKNE